MIHVVIKNSWLFLIFLMVSCHKPIGNRKTILTKTKEMSNDTLKIITNSDDPNFNFDLIETLNVKIGDTVLFRNWLTYEKNEIILFENENRFEISGDSIVKVYKTGKQKFYKHTSTISNKTTNEFYKIISTSILNNNKDAYHPEQPLTSPKFVKLSKSLGRMDFSCPLFKEFYIDFKITNGQISICKLTNLSYSYSQTYKYELDTLITLKNKNLIYPELLRDKTTMEKNRIFVKDPRKK